MRSDGNRNGNDFHAIGSIFDIDLVLLLPKCLVCSTCKNRLSQETRPGRLLKILGFCGVGMAVNGIRLCVSLASFAMPASNNTVDP